jgi:hypothetical protein
MFPSGTAGVALLALRVSVAATLVAHGVAARGPVVPLEALPVPLLLAIFLCLGFLTPYCAVLNCLIGLATLIMSGGNNELYPAIAVVDSGVVAVLGPGAYSIDARIFGRRLLTVPPRR